MGFFFPALIKLTDIVLSNRTTTFQLGDFRSEPKELTMSISQGSLLSVILYILYNTHLLFQAENTPNTISLGCIDNIAFATAGNPLEELTHKLQSLSIKEMVWGS